MSSERVIGPTEAAVMKALYPSNVALLRIWGNAEQEERLRAAMDALARQEEHRELSD